MFLAKAQGSNEVSGFYHTNKHAYHTNKHALHFLYYDTAHSWFPSPVENVVPLSSLHL